MFIFLIIQLIVIYHFDFFFDSWITQQCFVSFPSSWDLLCFLLSFNYTSVEFENIFCVISVLIHLHRLISETCMMCSWKDIHFILSQHSSCIYLNLKVYIVIFSFIYFQPVYAFNFKVYFLLTAIFFLIKNMFW